MPLQVLGAGFGRTGTMSLKIALEQLGFGPCHHMMEVFGKPDHIALWLAAAEKKPVEWEEILAGYHAAVDWPVCYFWKELADLYPDAKIILSKRDGEKWFDSASSTIFKALAGFKDDPNGKMARTIIQQNTFNGDLFDRENAIRIFNEHNQEVIDTIPAERLLVFEASQGWAPLCEFLQVPIPESDYPRANTAEDFHQRFMDNRRR